MVGWKKLGEVCCIRTGKLNANAQVENGKYPFFTCDAKPFRIDTFAFDTEAILISGNGSQVGHLNYYKGKFNAYQRTYVIDDFRDVNVFYLFHYLKSTIRPYVMDKSKKGSVPYITLPMLEGFIIPIPSLEEQTRIVGILDTFTSAIDNLKEQIAQRRKQYEYYRDQLLDLEGKPGVEMKEIWQLTAWDKKFQGIDLSMQRKVVQYSYLLAKDLFALSVPDGSVKLLSTGVQEGWTTEELAGDYLCEGEIVSIPWGKSPGAQNPVKYYKGKFVTGDNRIATSLNTKVLCNKYLYYWMCAKSDLIETFYRGAGIQHPSMFKVLTMPLPLPSLQEQSRIVSILDTFEASIQNLEAQLKEREKQYEYYRNKLLTFE